MKTLVAFADLAYIGKGQSSVAFPYAGAVVASYEKKNLEITSKLSFLSTLMIS